MGIKVYFKKYGKFVGYFTLLCVLSLVPILILIYQENTGTENRTVVPDNLTALKKLYSNDYSRFNDSSVIFIDVSQNIQYIQPIRRDAYNTTKWKPVIRPYDFERFLDCIKDVRFKAIFIDIAFDESYMDSAYIENIYSLLSRMDSSRIFIASDPIKNELPEKLKRYAISTGIHKDYNHIISRSEILHDFNAPDDMAKNSVAYHLYCRTENPQFRNQLKYCPFLSSIFQRDIFFCDEGFFRNNPIVKIIPPSQTLLSKEESGPTLNNFIQNEDHSLLEDKVIFAGDLLGPEDKHETYASKLGIEEFAGIYLIYCEYKTLRDKRFLIPWKLIVLLYIFYFVVTLLFIIIKSETIIALKRSIWKREKHENVKHIFTKQRMCERFNKFCKYVESCISWFNNRIKDYVLPLLILLIKLVGIDIILYGLTRYLYMHHDFLFSSTLTLVWFSFLGGVLMYWDSVKTNK